MHITLRGKILYMATTMPRRLSRSIYHKNHAVKVLSHVHIFMLTFHAHKNHTLSIKGGERLGADIKKIL
jgi:hypothetical protein